jgi:hypothetical protein
MTETSRVQRWRETKRQHGLKAITIWLTAEEELRLKDLALQWHCSPSAVMQRALAQVTMITPPQNGSTPDILQIREMIREELAVREAAQVPVTDTVTETATATVTETLARDLPGLVRQFVEGLALEALGLPTTDTDYSCPTDTGFPSEATPLQQETPRRRGRPGVMRQRIMALLGEHPEGLSAEQIRAYIQPEKPLGDMLQGMRKQNKVQTRGTGRDTRYFAVASTEGEHA